MKFFHSDIPRTDKVGELIFYLLDPFVSLNMGIYKLIGLIAGKSASKVVLYLVSTNRDDILVNYRYLTLGLCSLAQFACHFGGEKITCTISELFCTIYKCIISHGAIAIIVYHYGEFCLRTRAVQTSNCTIFESC